MAAERASVEVPPAAADTAIIAVIVVSAAVVVSVPPAAVAVIVASSAISEARFEGSVGNAQVLPFPVEEFPQQTLSEVGRVRIGFGIRTAFVQLAQVLLEIGREVGVKLVLGVDGDGRGQQKTQQGLTDNIDCQIGKDGILLPIS